MLNGRPALIVEEEFLIALDLQRMLESLGVGETLFARNAEEARRLTAQRSDIAIAIVELRIDQPENHALAGELRAKAVPMVAMTSDTRLSTRTPEDAPVLRKPIPEEALASAVRAALAGSG